MENIKIKCSALLSRILVRELMHANSRGLWFNMTATKEDISIVTKDIAVIIDIDDNIPFLAETEEEFAIFVENNRNIQLFEDYLEQSGKHNTQSEQAL